MSDGRKYFCFCEANCKFETMTKEQILAAIAQAAEHGLVFDADAAFITKVKESNAGSNLTFWLGTQAQYNALVINGKKDPNCFYVLTDCDSPAELTQKVKELQNKLATLTAADIGAAPAGYGGNGENISHKGTYSSETALCEMLSAEIETMPNASRKTIAASLDFSGLGGGYFVIDIYKPFAGYAYADASTYDRCWLRFSCRNNVWQPMEWVNPPMHIGVEYRTTERWNGKPVYKICGDMGTLPSKSFKTFTPKRADGSGVSATQIVGYGGITGTGYAFPMRGSDISADYFANVEMYVNTDITAWVYCNLDWATTTATLWFKYTKD